jgi:internalin A
MRSLCVTVWLLVASSLVAQSPAEREAVARITKLGGEATVDERLEARAQVNASFEKATDATLISLCKIPSVGEITISDGSKLTERGLGFLYELPNLQKLRLSKVTLTEKSGAAIAKCRTVQVLFLGECKSSDATYKDFQNLKAVTTLDLFDTKITDKGMHELAEMPKLADLNLAGSPITDKGLLELKEVKTLKMVKANRTNITQAGAKALEDAIPGCTVRQ